MMQDEPEEASVSGKKSNSKKTKQSKGQNMGGELRKKLWFDDFKMIEQHPTRDTRMTIKFKTMQRDYIFDFIDSREREVFMMKMRGLLPPQVFSAAEVMVTEHLRPNSYNENRVFDPILLSPPLHSLLRISLLSAHALCCLGVFSPRFTLYICPRERIV